MSDNTELFKRYLQIISEEQNDKYSDKNAHQINQRQSDKYVLKDTFVDECRELLRHIVEFQRIIIELTPKYESSSSEMTEQEKNEFDTESKLQLQQFFEKFKRLEAYEKQRQLLIDEKINNSLKLQFLSLTSTEDARTFHQTNNQFRTGLLQCLNFWLNTTSNHLSTIQQSRLARKRELDEINFNAQLYLPQREILVSHSPIITTTQAEIKQYEETMSKLSQDQLQLLETEHVELLNYKNEELIRVKALGKTVIEIASLQNELTTHLQVQTQNINSLLDNQTEVEVELSKGNRQLQKAKRSGDRLATLLMWFAIIAGTLLLFLDYIN